jgi:hypothetical protein
MVDAFYQVAGQGRRLLLFFATTGTTTTGTTTTGTTTTGTTMLKPRCRHNRNGGFAGDPSSMPFLEGQSGDPAGRPRGSQNRPRTGIGPAGADLAAVKTARTAARPEPGEGQTRPKPAAIHCKIR